MKLSEIKGERAIEVIAELIEPVSSLATNSEVMKMLNIRPNEGETARQAATRVLKSSAPVLLKSNKAEIAKILAVLENTEPEKLSLVKIFKGLAEMLSDETFIELFASAVPKGEQTPLTEEFNK